MHQLMEDVINMARINFRFELLLHLLCFFLELLFDLGKDRLQLGQLEILAFRDGLLLEALDLTGYEPAVRSDILRVEGMLVGFVRVDLILSVNLVYVQSRLLLEDVRGGLV